MAEPNFEKAYKGRTYDHPDHDAIARSRADKMYPKVRIRLEAAENSSKKLPKKNRRELCNKLYEHAVQHDIHVDNLFKDIDEKRSALETIMGYTKLNGFDSLETASPQAIAQAYKSAYYASDYVSDQAKKR